MLRLDADKVMRRKARALACADNPAIQNWEALKHTVKGTRKD
jgi:hypothetical protein